MKDSSALKWGPSLEAIWAFFLEKSFCINVLYCCRIEVYGIWTVDGISPTTFISVLQLLQLCNPV